MPDFNFIRFRMENAIARVPGARPISADRIGEFFAMDVGNSMSLWRDRAKELGMTARTTWAPDIPNQRLELWDVNSSSAADMPDFNLHLWSTAAGGARADVGLLLPGGARVSFAVTSDVFCWEILVRWIEAFMNACIEVCHRRRWTLDHPRVPMPIRLAFA